MNAAATLALWAFIGLESATVPAEEVKNPEKTIPRATIIGTLATTALYIVALIAIVGVLSQAGAAPARPRRSQTRRTPCGAARSSASPGASGSRSSRSRRRSARSTAGSCCSARVSLAAADDGLFPRPFRASGERSTPVFGLVASSALASGLVLYNWNVDFGARFTDIVLLATWMTLIAYAYAAAAEVVLFYRERELFSWVKMARDTVIAGLAFAYSVWAIWGSGEEWLAKGFMLLLFGIPVFVFMKWRESRRPKPEPVVPSVAPVPTSRATASKRCSRD